MLMRMHVVFLLCGTFLIPDIFTASKSTEKLFRPEDYEEVQDYSENFKENVVEPLIIEEFDRKKKNTCQGRQIILPTPRISCDRGPYKHLVEISKNTFIWLTKCKGYVKPRTQCLAIKKEKIHVNVGSQCFEEYNETKCEETCTTSPKDCTASQKFNNGKCECVTHETLF